MNKSINKVLIAIAATVLSSTAFAANWVQTPSSYEVDTLSIQRGRDFTSFWARSDGDETDKPYGVSSKYLFIDIKCATRESRLRRVVGYSLPKGEGKAVISATKETSFEPIPPETDGYYLYRFICTSRR